MTQRYSQNDEQDHILKFFGDRPGRFLDIGAYTGKEFSNTLALAERGWGGVCVEPSPGPFTALMRNHAGRRDITLVNCALATQPGWITFHDSGGDAISTLDPAHRAKWEAGWESKFNAVEVYAVTIPMLLEKYGTAFDFINLDVESLNWALFQTIPWAQLEQVKLVCVEHDGYNMAIQSVLEPLGFKLVAFNGENLIVGR